jgi:hypothetical protein
MTKKLDPEIKALRAVERALRPLDLRAKDRAVTWLRSRTDSELKRQQED